MKVKVTVKSILAVCMIQSSQSAEFDRDYTAIMDLVNKPGCADYYYPDDHHQQIKARGGDPNFKHMVQLLNQSCQSQIPIDMARLSKVPPEALTQDFMNRLLEKITPDMPCFVVDTIFEKHIRPLNPVYHMAALELRNCLSLCSGEEFLNLRQGLYDICPTTFEEDDFLRVIKAKINAVKEKTNSHMYWQEALDIAKQEDEYRTYKFMARMLLMNNSGPL